VCHRKITFEYLLLNGVNDGESDALDLAALLKNLECYVNLSNYNSVNEHAFKRSRNCGAFATVLMNHGIKVTTRLERGGNISAACGQLRAKYEHNK
jgi:23S rRNA (adenine2503-C2)-methyltransferase